METRASLMEVGDIVQTPHVAFSASTYRVRQINPEGGELRVWLDHRPASCPPRCHLHPVACEHWGTLPGHQVILAPGEPVQIVARADGRVFDLTDPDVDIRERIDLVLSDHEAVEAAAERS